MKIFWRHTCHLVNILKNTHKARPFLGKPSHKTLAPSKLSCPWHTKKIDHVRFHGLLQDYLWSSITLIRDNDHPPSTYPRVTFSRRRWQRRNCVTKYRIACGVSGCVLEAFKLYLPIDYWANVLISGRDMRAPWLGPCQSLYTSVYWIVTGYWSFWQVEFTKIVRQLVRQDVMMACSTWQGQYANPSSYNWV